ncbi:CG6974 [Drosophila busckii]|uniref:Metalloendopeptidase n=1 Tax=Drosophila busckii TaxID=30019 RepID=A0A0M5J6Z1_DROBS|nr:zinc metalloproteinase nas-4 [Drosophila busckii]ALC46381.1 CG6974 [Drosophila busckii]
MAKLCEVIRIVVLCGLLTAAVAYPVVEEEEQELAELSESMFGLPDSATGALLAAQSAETLQNPEELGNYYEGDILIPLQQNETRNGLLAMSKRWPGAVVPYEIKGKFSAQELQNIEHAFKEYHSRTCVRFKQRSNEKDYISIVNGKTGCWSSMGRIGGRQEVNLQSPNCLRTYGTPIHELMHALGFMHEQNRHERDRFVQVLSENVKPEMLVNFDKSSARIQSAFGIGYDYASVMHYSPTSFSKNGQPTLKALMNSAEARQMGQRRGFSNSDVAKINAMYKCKV